MARDAMAEPNKRFVLVIDELNRGNLAKVFGELYFLLEYRGKAMRLQYSEADFVLPENLWIIGTMNSTDRTISLLDAALRRRFYFLEFFQIDGRSRVCCGDGLIAADRKWCGWPTSWIWPIAISAIATWRSDQAT